MFQEMTCGRGEDLELGGRRGSSRPDLQDVQINVLEGHPGSQGIWAEAIGLEALCGCRSKRGGMAYRTEVWGEKGRGPRTKPGEHQRFHEGC